MVIRHFVISMLLLAVLAAPLMAQEGTSGITGRAADTSGAVIPGVDVTLTSAAVMGTRQIVTDERGTYRFNLLPQGSYTLKFELPGFKTLIREDVRLTAGFTATINVEMEVATQAETVTVTGQSPVVDLQSSAVAVNFTQSLLTNLPNARDVWSTLGQTPGIMMGAVDVGGSKSGQSTSVRNYGTDGQSYFMLDGVRYNNQYLDYGAYEEMQVVTASKNAEMRNAGTYMNSIVKTGSNDFHGMVYGAETPGKLQGNNLNDRLRGFGLTTPNKLSFFGDLNGNVGGPIKKDKFWWFLSMRDNYIGTESPGYLKGGCTTSLACTGKPLGTYANDRPSEEPGNFYIRLGNATLKMNGSITPKNQVSVMANYSDKRMPFRGGGLTGNAGFLNTDSVGRQTYPGWIYKAQWSAAISNRVTFDTSFNRSGFHYPIDRRVDEYSRRDLDTQQVRGGFSGEAPGFAAGTGTPYTWDTKLYHYNFTVSTIVGNHSAKFGYGWKYLGSPRKQRGTIGQIILYYRGGFKTPAFIETLDTPFLIDSRLQENSFFAQDSWKVTPQLTLNLGFRFDRALPYYPRQEKDGSGLFQTKQVVEQRNLVPLNGLVPRFSAIYDISGKGKTALKASYGRYNLEAGETETSDLSASVNPMTLLQTRYAWDGTFPAMNCYLTGCTFNPAGKTPVTVIGGKDRDINPDIKFPYTEEYAAGLDHQLMTDLSLNLTVVRKFEQNRWQIFNTAIPYSGYNIPVNGTDPGRDGVAGTADDKTITVYSLDPVYVGKRKDLIGNNPSADNSSTALEVTVVKRLSNKWQVVTGWNYLVRKIWSSSQIANDNAGYAQDPNNLRYNAGQHYNAWTYKAAGTYQAPYGISISSVFRSAKGNPYGRRWNSPSLTQGVQTLTVEPVGAFFMDTIKVLDFRVEKTFTVTERHKVSAMFDLFNSLNAATITAVNDLTGVKFGTPTQTVEPRVARLGVRYTF